MTNTLSIVLLQACTADGCCNIAYTATQAAVAAFLAITFLQSGLDKVFNYKGNAGYLKGHFEKSPLKGTTGALLPVITLLELAAGALSAFGIVMLLVDRCDRYIFWGSFASAVALLCLFFGQRMAKDYSGAQSLIGYFLVALAGMYLCA